MKKQTNPLDAAYDRFLRTLCNKSRFSIVQSLRIKPKNVTELTKELGLHQTSVSHSLRRLLDCGFVTVKRNGKEREYTVNSNTIKPLMAIMEKHVDLYCKRCCT